MPSSVTIIKLRSGVTYLRARASGQDRSYLESKGDSQRRESHPPPRASVHTESSQSDSPLSTGYSQNGSQSESVSGPPPLMRKLSPYARVSLPTMYRRPPKIHPLLTPEGSSSFIWTLCMPPSTASFKLGQPQRREQYHWTALPATNVVNLISLTIRIDPFPTPVVVMPAPHSGRISVYDVLAAVYTGARRGAIEMSNVRQKAKLDMNWAGPPAYLAGAAELDDAICQDVRQYMRFCTRWVGLVPSDDEPDIWVVRTKLTMDRW